MLSLGGLSAQYQSMVLNLLYAKLADISINEPLDELFVLLAVNMVGGPILEEGSSYRAWFQYASIVHPCALFHALFGGGFLAQSTSLAWGKTPNKECFMSAGGANHDGK